MLICYRIDAREGQVWILTYCMAFKGNIACDIVPHN